jgi:hypothetical protein
MGKDDLRFPRELPFNIVPDDPDLEETGQGDENEKQREK